MTQRDRELLEIACESTFRSTIKRLMSQAESEECRSRLESLLRAPEMVWED